MIKKFSLGFLLIPIAILLLIILLFVISPITNNITLSNFASQLYNYPLPAKTTLIEKEMTAGKLTGNGNGMDFLACILIKSDGFLDEIKQYYTNASFKNAKPGGSAPTIIEVAPANGYKLETEYLEHQDIYFDALKYIKDYTGYYVVILTDEGYDGGFDLRGH